MTTYHAYKMVDGVPVDVAQVTSRDAQAAVERLHGPLRWYALGFVEVTP